MTTTPPEAPPLPELRTYRQNNKIATVPNVLHLALAKVVFLYMHKNLLFMLTLVGASHPKFSLHIHKQTLHIINTNHYIGV